MRDKYSMTCSVYNWKLLFQENALFFLGLTYLTLISYLLCRWRESHSSWFLSGSYQNQCWKTGRKESSTVSISRFSPGSSTGKQDRWGHVDPWNLGWFLQVVAMPMGETVGVYIGHSGTHRHSVCLFSKIYTLSSRWFNLFYLFLKLILNVMPSRTPKCLISSFMHLILFSCGFAHYNIISTDRHP